MAHPENFALTEEEHRAILEALKKRDADRGVEQFGRTSTAVNGTALD